MRIDLNNKLQSAQDISEAETKSPRTPTDAPVKYGLGDDSAQLSPDQVRVQALASQVNKLPDVRQEKVTAIGLAIEQGNYQVTPEQTAEAMLNEIRSAA